MNNERIVIVQKIMSSLTDMAFFAAIVLMGIFTSIEKTYLVLGLILYAQGRFGTKNVAAATQGMTTVVQSSSSGSMRAIDRIPPTSMRPEGTFPTYPTHPEWSHSTAHERPAMPPPPKQVRSEPKRPLGKPIPRDDDEGDGEEERSSLLALYRRILKPAFAPVMIPLIVALVGLVGAFFFVACAEALPTYERGKNAADEVCSLVRALPEIASASTMPSDSAVVVYPPNKGAPSFAKVVPTAPVAPSPSSPPH